MMSFWIAILWIAIGICLLFISIKEFIKVSTIIRNGMKVTGRIVDLIEDDKSDHQQFFPVIEYTIPTGQVFRTKSSHSWLYPKIDQEIEIIYHRDKPEKIVVNRFLFKYFGSVMGIVMSVIGIVMGVVNLF